VSDTSGDRADADLARLLIVTGEAASDLDRVPFGARLLIDGASEILVVAPSLPTRLAWLASDTDKTREVADKRLGTVLEQLGDAGATVEGAIGADDPLLVFEDAVSQFHPQHILVALRGAKDSGWQERGLIDKVLARFELPVTIFTIRD
jgi:hypothetical protein